MTTPLQDFWKDDFAPLRAAGQAVLDALRQDEAAPDADLYRRMTTSGVGSHLYFSNDTSGGGSVVVQLQHVKSVPLPSLLRQELASTRSQSLMGLLASAGLAWMSVDDKVYLWSFAKTDSFCSFQVPSGQSIVSVGLVRPQKGIFKASVEWCLVVTTPDEVLLCALVRDRGQNGMAHDQDSSLRLVPTSFSIPNDTVRILSIQGTRTGRIFLGGDDGCLYEMEYGGHSTRSTTQPQQYLPIDERLDQFYDQGVDLPAVIHADGRRHGSSVKELWTLGKRAWSVQPEQQQPQKCRRLNRTSNASSLASILVPDFLCKAGSFLFGAKTGGGKIVQMVMDEERHCLYTLSHKGWIASFDIKTRGRGVQLMAVMQTPQTARLYLEAVARGQMLPPSTRQAGTISFPGGGAAAQAGVGGMEGARAILKQADLQQSSRNTANILVPTSIQIVPRTESSRLTLVAVTRGGLRYYLSSLARNVLSTGPSGQQQASLGPSRQLTLCHIRSPPPSDMERLQDLSSSSIDSGIVGGVAPRVPSSADKVGRVDASYYNQGVFVAAVESKSNRQGELVTQRPTVGDTLVAACPDAVARKMENATDETTRETARDSSRPKPLTVPGGITETLSLPMAAAYGSSSTSTEMDPILPGGIVWDIASISEDESTVLTLAANSQTPTDTELDIGLPPAYFPPLKFRSRVLPQTYDDSRRDQQGAIVPRQASLSSTAFTVLGNVLTNILLSRPIRHGLTFQRPMLDGEASFGSSHQPHYRLSKRDASKGFSATAGEVSSRSASRSRGSTSASPSKAPRSARLRPWLLRPAVVPLNQFSTQHLVEGKEIVALNAGGLHYFGFNTILSNLAKALIAAGDSVSSDPTITSFFSSYGFKEGCAMCLALAIGCFPAAGNAGFSDQVRRRASDAALARAYVPKLIAQAEQSGSVMMTDAKSTSDPLVPPGYDFKPSALYDGLNTFFSRLVRPIWHKPVVVVTEGRIVKLSWSSGTKSTPAKVEILLDNNCLEEIRAPLRSLLSLVKNVFSRAVKTVPGLQQSQANMMEIDDDSGESQYLTRALQYHSHLRAGDGGSATRLTIREAEHLAHLIEEKNIHSLYRLLARVVQLLNLISLLRRADDMVELREVDWGLLHGLTTSQLVQTSDGQDRLESLLNALVTGSATDSTLMVAPSAQADQLANQFAEQCYLFFSPGSRFAYLGLRQANEALSYPVSSSRRTALASQAATHLRSAAQHWHSAPLITGRILHNKGQETHDQIALRAMQYGSPLAKAVSALIQLEDVPSVVEVCLLTASNFKDTRFQGVKTADPFGLGKVGSSFAFAWEKDLYHKRREPEQNGGGTSSSPSSPSSPSQNFAYGTAVTSRDAIDTCYALVFYHLSLLLNTRPELADRMVSSCAAATDRSFLEAFFLQLLESNHTDTLLRINSPELEKWIRDRHEPDLLWRYYNVQGKHMEGGKVSWDRACDMNLKLTISERIEYLSRALNSFRAALDEGQAGFGIGSEDVAQKVKEVNETLHVARLQNRILRAIESMKPDIEKEISLEKLERLASTLVSVSDLYNEYAAAASLFDHCLLILHACRHDDVQAIQTLWKSVICEEILPCATRSEPVYSFLQTFCADLGLNEEVHFLDSAAVADTLAIFEDGEWVKRLGSKIISLGKELYGTGADYVFPVDYLLFVMEALRQAAENVTGPEWPLKTLADVGVPFLVILDAYESMCQKDDHILLGGADPRRRLDQLTATVELLNYWVSTAHSGSIAGSGTSSAQQELGRAVAAGRLMPKIDSLRSKLEMTPGTSSLLDRLRLVEEGVHYIA